MITVKRLLVATITVVVTPILVGCTTAGGGSITLPPQNQEKWVLPLDEFTDTSAPLRDYAEALIERGCYAKKGIDWPVPWQPIDRRGLGPSVSPGMQEILTSKLAAQYGYHTAPVTYDGVKEWKQFVQKTNEISSPNFGSAMDFCQGVSRKALPLPSQDASYYALHAAQQIFKEVLLTPKLTADATAWAQCMTTAGYGGMASSPDHMPPNNKAEIWNVGIPGTTAGPEEITVASTDMTCRIHSGWTAALYQGEWKRQADFVKKNSDRLIRIRDELATERTRLLKAVSDHAPKKVTK